MFSSQVTGDANVGSMPIVSETDVRVKVKLHSVFAHCVILKVTIHASPEYVGTSGWSQMVSDIQSKLTANGLMDFLFM
jgi:hypothetical protein